MMDELTVKPTQEGVEEIVLGLLEVNKNIYLFIKDLSIVGLTYDLLIDHFKYRCDFVLESLGYEKMFNIETKLLYMMKKDIGIRSTSFFTSKSVDYTDSYFTEEDLELTF